ncbi:hypothetical protein NIES4101_56070 [Calothrix sp. NIES-4101]|nr:hypothetical protein NIES4101_56070 [Calothrix sp. NIES-4101]
MYFAQKQEFAHLKFDLLGNSTLNSAFIECRKAIQHPTFVLDLIHIPWHTSAFKKSYKNHKLNQTRNTSATVQA